MEFKLPLNNCKRSSKTVVSVNYSKNTTLYIYEFTSQQLAFIFNCKRLFLIKAETYLDREKPGYRGIRNCSNYSVLCTRGLRLWRVI